MNAAQARRPDGALPVPSSEELRQRALQRSSRRGAFVAQRRLWWRWGLWALWRVLGLVEIGRAHV